MRNFLIGASALVSAALLANTAAQAAGAKYVPIALPSGAVTVLPFGINDNNIVAGGYTDADGVLHEAPIVEAIASSARPGGPRSY